MLGIGPTRPPAVRPLTPVQTEPPQVLKGRHRIFWPATSDVEVLHPQHKVALCPGGSQGKGPGMAHMEQTSGRWGESSASTHSGCLVGPATCTQQPSESFWKRACHEPH